MMRSSAGLNHQTSTNPHNGGQQPAGGDRERTNAASRLRTASRHHSRANGEAEVDGFPGVRWRSTTDSWSS